MRFLRTRPALFGLAGLVVVAVALGIGVAVMNATPEPTPTPRPTASPSPTPSPTPSPSPSATPSPTPSPTPVAVCPFNGEPLAEPALAERVPILVQIENNPIARPPSGLNRADMVFEATVEGDTTRFSAIFMCDEEVGAAVGPVRSARYFNIDYWQQMHVLTLHFGGAGQVLARFERNGMPFANGLTNGWGFFYRAGPWGAPHNVFLDVDAARAEIENGVLTERASRTGEARAPLVFDPDADPPSGRSVESVGIQTTSFWRFGWHWDGDEHAWKRTDGGAPNSDATTGTQISANTVLVQIVDEDVLPGELDPGGFPRRFQHLVGEGQGLLYLDGQGFNVRWSRPDAASVTTWTYTNSGNPVILPPGKVWWEVVPVGTVISED